MSGKLKNTTQESKKATPKPPARAPVNDQLNPSSEESLVLERTDPKDTTKRFNNKKEIQNPKPKKFYTQTQNPKIFIANPKPKPKTKKYFYPNPKPKSKHFLGTNV